MSIGCPKDFPDKPVTQESGDSKHDVRCCSTNGDSCTSQPCQGSKTYQEASEICSRSGTRLCFEHELNKCCRTGCGYDATMNWVAAEAQGILYTFGYMIFC